MPSSERSAYYRVAATKAEGLEAAAAALISGLGPDPAVLLLFFAGPDHDVAALSARFATAWPDAVIAGCTSAGELGPEGITEGGISAVAIGGPCRVSALLLDDLSTFRFEDGAELVSRLARGLGREGGELSGVDHVLLTLTDGLSGLEEILVASLAVHASGVPLVGGSAGDAFRFQCTRVVLGDQVSTNGAVVLLLEPHAPFQVIHVHHFHPTETRVIVTEADPEHRIIRELDGWPAVSVMARVLGISEQEIRGNPLRIFSERAVTLGYQVGGTHFLRSVMTARGDALLMGGAIEEGTVLRVMQGGNLLEATRQGVEHALSALATEPAGLVLFNCGGRLLEAQGASIVDELYQAMSLAPAAGFSTYGEQYGALQVNHTLTGIAFGRPRGE